MAKQIEIGTKLGKLTVVSGPEVVYSWHFSKKLGRETRYTSYCQKCRCDCGSLTKVLVGNLLKQTRSCGCLKREQTATRNRETNTTHGLSRTSEYRIWCGMLQRCHNENDPAYYRYGGRGITVAEEWRTSFPAFFAHIGARPGKEFSVDRIDNNRGYEPGNVRWANAADQQKTARRKKLYLTAPDGRTLSAKEWAAELGISRTALFERVKAGKTGADLFSHSQRSRL